MKIPALIAPFALVFMALGFIALPAQADMSAPFMECSDGRTCMEKKVDYGYAEITCTDAETRSAVKWGCEYEWGYQCRLGNTDEFRKGGYLPIMTRLCDHLCGPCSSGWN